MQTALEAQNLSSPIAQSDEFFKAIGQEITIDVGLKYIPWVHKTGGLA